MDNLATQHYNDFLKGTRFQLKGNKATTLEDRIFLMLHRELSELCMNRFKWHNLPDSIDVRFLEKTLFRSGLSVFYWEHKYDKFLTLPGGAWKLDDQDNPTGFTVTGTLIGTRQLTAQECVPIWANYSRSSDLDIVGIYARRLARLDRTVDINLGNARQPKILVAAENVQLSVENFSRQIEEGQPTIRIRPELLDSVNVLDMGVDANLFEKVSLARTRIWNECMGLLGIKHANQDKKERLVSDEVAANDEQIAIMKAVHLNARKIAADQINRKYGLDVHVEYDEDVTDSLESVNFDANENESLKQLTDSISELEVGGSDNG